MRTPGSRRSAASRRTAPAPPITPRTTLTSTVHPPSTYSVRPLARGQGLLHARGAQHHHQLGPPGAAPGPPAPGRPRGHAGQPGPLRYDDCRLAHFTDLRPPKKAEEGCLLFADGLAAASPAGGGVLPAIATATGGRASATWGSRVEDMTGLLNNQRCTRGERC